MKENLIRQDRKGRYEQYAEEGVSLRGTWLNCSFFLVNNQLSSVPMNHCLPTCFPVPFKFTFKFIFSKLTVSAFGHSVETKFHPWWWILQCLRVCSFHQISIELWKKTIIDQASRRVPRVLSTLACLECTEAIYRDETLAVAIAKAMSVTCHKCCFATRCLYPGQHFPCSCHL